MKKSKLPEPKKIETTKDGLKLSNYLNAVVNEKIFSDHEKAHYWATYILYKLKSELKAYHDNIKETPQYEEYQERLKELKEEKLAEIKEGKSQNFNLDTDKLDQEFPDFVKRRESLKDEPLNLEIRPFLAKWAFEIGASIDVSGILIEFDLVDNPDEILEYIYSSDTVKKDEKKDEKKKK